MCLIFFISRSHSGKEVQYGEADVVLTCYDRIVLGSEITLFVDPAFANESEEPTAANAFNEYHTASTVLYSYEAVICPRFHSFFLTSDPSSEIHFFCFYGTATHIVRIHMHAGNAYI